MLKGSRCESAKCPIEKQERLTAPGQHGWRRSRGSDYGVRIREKQKLKRFYGLLDRQFMRYYHEAVRKPGNTGKILLELLERRLDNVVYKLNFAPSRKEARQVITHGHIYLNGRRVDIPDITVKIGDKITVKNSDRSRKLIKRQLETNHQLFRPGLVAAQYRKARGDDRLHAHPGRYPVGRGRAVGRRVLFSINDKPGSGSESKNAANTRECSPGLVATAGVLRTFVAPVTGGPV